MAGAMIDPSKSALCTYVRPSATCTLPSAPRRWLHSRGWCWATTSCYCVAISGLRPMALHTLLPTSFHRQGLSSHTMAREKNHAGRGGRWGLCRKSLCNVSPIWQGRGRPQEAEGGTVGLHVSEMANKLQFALGLRALLAKSHR